MNENSVFNSISLCIKRVYSSWVYAFINDLFFFISKHQDNFFLSLFSQSSPNTRDTNSSNLHEKSDIPVCVGSSPENCTCASLDVLFMSNSELDKLEQVQTQNFGTNIFDQCETVSVNKLKKKRKNKGSLFIQYHLEVLLIIILVNALDLVTDLGKDYSQVVIDLLK